VTCWRGLQHGLCRRLFHDIAVRRAIASPFDTELAQPSLGREARSLLFRDASSSSSISSIGQYRLCGRQFRIAGAQPRRDLAALDATPRSPSVESKIDLAELGIQRGQIAAGLRACDPELAGHINDIADTRDRGPTKEASRE